ncbi:F-box protein SKP2A-like isoform X5 [Phoenix dactylifera]|nr:F-box protein SKP2A-like isoform X5 [Phoenix dactylifera]
MFRSSVDMVSGGLGSGNLEAWFQNLMLSAGGEKSGGEGAAMAGWKDLPMELLLRIISLLDDRTVIVVSGVCTGWRDALCFGLTNLSLSWCTNNMNSLVQSLAPKFTKLQVLTLRQDRPQLEDIAVEAVANYCHDLRDLDLSKSFRLTDCSLYALAHGCPRLTKLNISGCSAFSDSALAYLTSYCRNLKNLNLCGCVRAATDRALQAIAYNCIQLQTLNLGWCEDISDNGVTSLAAGCPDLRALDLCGCVLITVFGSDGGIQRFLVRLRGRPKSGYTWIQHEEMPSIDPDLLEYYRGFTEPLSSRSTSFHLGRVAADTSAR